MDWLHKLIKQGKSAEEISRIMELDRDTVEALMERNYRKEYDNYHAQPEQREKNAARLRARRLMVKKGKVKKKWQCVVKYMNGTLAVEQTKSLLLMQDKESVFLSADSVTTLPSLLKLLQQSSLSLKTSL